MVTPTGDVLPGFGWARAREETVSGMSTTSTALRRHEW